MTELFAAPAGIAAYGATAHAMAGEIAAAGTTAGGAAAVLLAPVFGLIGADFVAAFGATQAGHAGAIAALAHTAAALGEATTTAATNYTGTDGAHATAIDATVGGRA